MYVPHHHLLFHVSIFGPSTDQPSLSIILLSLSSRTMTKKGKMGFEFTVAELKHMLIVIDDIFPIGNSDWAKVWQKHSAAYPTMERTAELVKRKFQELVRKKILLGTPTVLLMFAMPSEFRGKLFLLPMGRLVVPTLKQKASLAMRTGGG
jgi:hypothetical protein